MASRLGWLVVAPGSDFSDVALIAVVGRSVVEDKVVNTGAIDGVQLGAACGAFGHIRTPEAWSEEREPVAQKQNAPASGGVGDRRSGGG